MASSSRPSKKPKVESTTLPNWLELPRDITANILKRLGVIEILKTARNVCPLWWYICKDPLMWRTIHMSDANIFTVDPSHLVNICRYAVDLSCGHLEEIDSEHFGTDDLLNYIADSATHLRCIRIDSCLRISHKGLCAVSKKIPLVEEFHISSCFASEDSLKLIGRSCPRLKSLKFSDILWKTILKCDNEAFAIANTMSGLRHLNIYGNPLSDVGLIAILDGCPLLESLDIRGCANLDFSGNLRKRCHDQIKDLRCLENYPYYFSDFDTLRNNVCLCGDSGSCTKMRNYIETSDSEET